MNPAGDTGTATEDDDGEIDFRHPVSKTGSGYIGRRMTLEAPTTDRRSMPAELISVRLCTAEDLPALHAREAHPSARIAQRHFDLQSAGDYYYAVAFRGTTPMGTCSMDTHRHNPLCPELMNLWVYPDSRRQGAAKAMTAFLESQAAGLGYVEVFLRVDPNNEAAIPMYIGLEYTPTGDHLVTKYETVDPAGVISSIEETDAIYRKSLLTR